MRKTPYLLVGTALVACGAPPGAAGPASTPATPSGPAGIPVVAAPVPPPAVVDDAFIRAYADSRRFTRGAPQAARLTPDGRAVLFLRSGPHDAKQSLFETDVTSGATRELLAPEAVDRSAEHLTLEERARRERMRITANGFTSFLLSTDGRTIVVALSGKLYALDRASGKAHLVEVGKGAAIDPRLSPDGKLLAYVQDDDVHVVAVDGASRPRALTRGGTDMKPHGLADFCASEELFRYHGFFWSPDSQAILWEETDATKVEKLTIADPAHPENPPDIVAYPRAGHPNPVLRFGITRIASPGVTTWVEWDPRRVEYVANVVWSEHAPPTLVIFDRLQKNAAVLTVDPATGKTHEAIAEHDDAWVNVDASAPEWLPDGSAFVWKSERDGDQRYGLVPALGGPVRWLTPPGVQAEQVDDLDGARRTLTFTGTRDGLHREVMRASLDGGDMTSVARRDDGSIAADFTPRNHDVFLAHEESLTAPHRIVVRSRDGRELREVPSVAQVPPLPHVELTTVGPEAVRVAILRPRNAIPAARYPVVDAAYGGPWTQVVSSDASAYLLDQWMADATGAVVVSIDAKGTPGRGRAWERAILDHLGDVPVDGHVAAIQALASTHPELDGSRVGVFGWSFGGYFATMAVLRRPDFYKAGVAVAPGCTDWRNYDTAYTERYLGLPGSNAAAYDAASALAYARKPASGNGPQPALLIAHGTADDNVYFLNSLQLADALAKSGRPFRFLPFLGQTHQFADVEAMEAVRRATAEALRAGLAK